MNIEIVFNTRATDLIFLCLFAKKTVNFSTRVERRKLAPRIALRWLTFLSPLPRMLSSLSEKT